jgi:hypothetical protein
MTPRFRSLVPFLLVSLLVAVAAPASAGEVDKTFPFTLDQWFDLGASDGPVTLHRVRIVREGGLTKSRIMRPGNSEYLEDVQIQLEFSNDSTRDWEARFRLEWVDDAGRTIDGYNGSENLDDDSRHDQQTITLSTLRYGIDRARKLRVRIDFDPD